MALGTMSERSSKFFSFVLCASMGGATFATSMPQSVQNPLSLRNLVMASMPSRPCSCQSYWFQGCKRFFGTKKWQKDPSGCLQDVFTKSWPHCRA